MKKFDLTTKAGIEEASKFFEAGIMVYNPLLGLLYKFAKSALKRIFTTPEETGKVVEALIEKGKKDGVDEMEIEFYDKGGFNFKAPIEGVEIEAHVGKDQKTRMKVKYK